MRLAIVTMALFSMAFSIYGAALPEIVPQPQEMAWTSGAAAWLETGTLQGVRMDEGVSAAQAAIDRLGKKLGTPLASSADGKLRLELGPLDGAIPERTRAEAYRLVVDASGAFIRAETVHGIHNGLITLTALASSDGRIPCVTVTDWPDQELRGTYAGSMREAEERFDQFVMLKLNMLLVEDGLLFDLDNEATLARVKRLAGQCRANFIEFVPELQSLGWGMFVLQREPRAVEGRWIEEAAFTVRDGRVHSPDPPLPQTPVIPNANFASGLENWIAQTHDGQRWRTSSDEETAVVAHPDDPSRHALKLTATGKRIIRIEQTIDIQPNAQYELSATVKTKDIEGHGAFIEVYGVRKSGALGAYIGRPSGRITGSHDGQTITASFNTERPEVTLFSLRDAEPEDMDPYEKVRIFLRIEDSSGTAWFSDLELRPVQQPNPLSNVVMTDTAPVLLQSEDGAITYEEGKDYTLSEPVLKYPFDSGPPLEIVLSTESRIKEGDTVLLSYNQARKGDITCCPSEPLYQNFMRKTIQDVVTRLDSKYLHIGHDEPRVFNRDQRCRGRGISNQDLFIEDIKRMREYALEANPGIRIMLWDDAINPYQNGPHLDTSEVAEYLPRDLIINIWWYDNHTMKAQMDDSIAFFIDLGYEVTGSPWFRIPNAYHWAKLFDDAKENPKALGILYTSWAEVPEPWGALEFTAEHAWSFGKPAYTPEPGLVQE